METEKEKMLSGKLYDASDKELVEWRTNTRLLLKAFNDCSEDRLDERVDVLGELLPNGGENLYIQPPFYCDYGGNITTGENVFLNFNCTILDVAPVTIGNRTLLGPNVQLYTATHPLDYKLRATGLESAKPITVGSDVWIGGGAIICPGVTIGNRTVIGAGSVVTKDIPAGVFAGGNPCKVIRELESED